MRRGEECGGGKELNECIVEKELGGCVEYGESVQGCTCFDLHWRVTLSEAPVV